MGSDARVARRGYGAARALVWSILLALLGCLAMAADAAPAADPGGGRISVPPARIDRTDVEPWLDGFMALALPRGDIAGATVAIVKDGRIVLTKGYGYADVTRGVPVDAERHLFRVASITKLFTWTAVMQQVERGRIDLDADVNRYLDFTIPPFRGRPVTMRALMTHTAGFELVMRDLFSARPNGVDLGATVKRWVPARIFAPGTTPTYSNYGTALAGYIVERVSGEPYDDYVYRHILVPLRMTRSSTRQPVPPVLAPDLSQAYLLGSGSAFPYEYTLHRPAGSLASTAPDIARFMIAQLNGGALGAGRILRPETVRAMHAASPSPLPPLHAMALGFAQHDVNGHRVLAHDGDTRFFHSQLNLFVDDGVGLFVSVNSTGRDGAADILRSTLFTAFANRYFPGKMTDGKVDRATARRHARAMAGRYEVSDRSTTNFLALNGFLHQTVVTTDDEGDLLVPDLTGADGSPKRWREIAPFVWREVGGVERLAARLTNGRPTRFGVDDYAPLIVWDRVPWWRSTAWLQPLGQAALAMLLVVVVAFPAGAVVRRYKGASTPARQEWRWTGIWLAALTGLLVPQLWMEIIAPVMSFTADSKTIGFQVVAASALTLLAYGGGLVLVLTTLGSFPKDRWRARLSYIALVASFAVLFWIAWVSRLVSFRTDF